MGNDLELAMRDELEESVGKVVELSEREDFFYAKLKVLKGFAKQRLFNGIINSLEVTEMQTNQNGCGDLVFGVVHWNAPEFLQLNVRQLERLHPEAKIYVFDNASSQENLNTVKDFLKTYKNVTLLSNTKSYSGTWACHITGLQYLLEYSARQNDKVLVFLDQDCIITQRLDKLANRLSSDVLLVGVRDYVEKTHSYGPMKEGLFRKWYSDVHASFMILQPKIIYGLFGRKAFLDGYSFEPYHGLSKRLAGKILFLETEMHPTIAMLTRYFLDGETFAWHSWFSSRVYGMKDKEVLDLLPVHWIKLCLRQAYVFLQNIVGGSE